MDKVSLLNQSFSTNKEKSNLYKSTQRTRGLSLNGTQSIHRGDLGKFTFKQAGMTSVFKGIQSNDVSKIMGTQNVTLLPTIRKGSFVYQVDEKKTERGNVHNNLISSRKRFDQIKDEVRRAQQELDQLREDNEMLIKREQEMQSQQKNVKVSQAYEEDMSMAKILYENAYWQYKSYQQVRRRLKDDMVSYDLKQNAINEQIRLIDFSSRQSQVHAVKSQQFNHQTQKIMENMLQNIEQEQKSREQELESFKEDFRKKQEIERQNEQREQKQNYISEHAMHDKDLTEKKWRQLLMVHQLVNQMFKAKMDRELKKFEIIEMAYQKIKQSTGISDAQEIVDRFLAREQTYGELLASIAEYENRIEQLNQNKDYSNRNLDVLKQEQNSMEMNKKKVSVALDQDLNKKLETVDDQSKRVELEKERIYQWCIKTLLQIQKVEQQNKIQQTNMNIQQQEYLEQENEEDEKSLSEREKNGDKIKGVTKQVIKKQHVERINYYEIYSRQQLVELFNIVSQKLNEIIQRYNINNNEVREIYKSLNHINPSAETTKETFFSRNTRILPPIRQKSIQSDPLNDVNDYSNSNTYNACQSYIGGGQENDIYDTEEENNDDAEEKEYILNMRENILRGVFFGSQKKIITEEQIKKGNTNNKLIMRRNETTAQDDIIPGEESNYQSQAQRSKIYGSNNKSEIY